MPDLQHFRYQRAVANADGVGTQACAVLDGQLYAHAAPSLTDVRLYDAAHTEIPYVLTLSEAATAASDSAAVLNLGVQQGKIVFDLEMPARPYTSVDLELDGKDFIATATVSGERSGSPPTLLGEYTLFDLSAQHLGRNTTLPLAESTFPRLHIELTMTPAAGTPAQNFAPSLVHAASVPPSREAQTIYTPVAETASFTHINRQTVAAFHLPARVPVERVEFVLPETFKANFSWTVTVSARSHSAPAGSATEQLTGKISRVEITQSGHTIHEQHLSVPGILGANFQYDADVEVAIEDGRDGEAAPLPIAAVRLEMRQRKLCFAAPATAATLFYGDPALRAPSYEYARLYTPADDTRTATLAAEQLNPLYQPRPDARPFTDRHPELLWLVLIAVFLALGFVAFRSARRLPK